MIVEHFLPPSHQDKELKVRLKQLEERYGEKDMFRLKEFMRV